MTSAAATPEQYLAELPEDRQKAMETLRKTIKKNLPKGFRESMMGGMLNYCVPLSLYPAGYHCTPGSPLPFLAVASQKNFIAVYHMGLYSSPALLKWFTEEYPKHSKTKLDMGKSCIRFKKPDSIPFELIGQLVSKMTPEQWIARYEEVMKK